MLRMAPNPRNFVHVMDNGVIKVAMDRSMLNAPSTAAPFRVPEPKVKRGAYRCKKCKQFKVDPETGKSHVCTPAATEKPEPPKPPPTCTGGAGVGVESAIDM